MGESMRGRSELGLRTLVVLPRAERHGGLRSCGAMSAAHSSKFRKELEGREDLGSSPGRGIKVTFIEEFRLILGSECEPRTFTAWTLPLKNRARAASETKGGVKDQQKHVSWLIAQSIMGAVHNQRCGV